MAEKKIRLYKVNEDGTLDKNSQLLPETDAESVIYEKKTETNISLLDVPNWEEFSEIGDDWLTIYEDLSGKIIQAGNYDSAYMVEIMDTTNGSGYIITNTTSESFTADTWYEFAGQGSLPVQTTTPNIKLDAQNIIESYEYLFNAITSSETVTITKTVKTQLDAPIKEATYDFTQKLTLLDIPNWENIIEAMSSGSSGTIYYYEGADRSIQIGCGKYDDSSSDYDYRYTISITDYDMSTSNERIYHIQNVTTPWNRKDVWYESVFDGQSTTDIPITTPDIPLDPQYAEGTEYGALFDSITGNKQINTTLQDKLEEPLKDKTYGKIEVVKEVPNDFVDNNEYEYYDNMNFSSSDYELLNSLSDGMLIYEDEDGGTANYLITLSINNGTTALEVYDAYKDITYIYTIYASDSFVNEWDSGTIPADLTVYTAAIRKNEVLKRMLKVGTHTEVEYENQTLEEKNADIKNWKYEDGLKDIPDWSKFESLTTYQTFYNDSDKIVIRASYDSRNYCYSIDIIDVENTKQYTIYSESVSFSEVSFEKNKWYEGILYDRETIPTQCDTPKINLSKQYVIIDAEYQDLYNNLFDAIYQSLTVDDKFNSMDGLLKDKIYDKLAEELVDGQSYGLTDNYDEFFEKYSTEQSQLIYGNPGNSSGSTPIEEPLLAGSSKAVDVPNILTIYLNTGATPIRGGENLTKDKIQDAQPPLGAANIAITTSDNHSLNFYVNTNSWQEYYNGDWEEVPLQYVPKLILDSSFIYNEEMLKDFLQLGYKEQTLKEKLDVFKDWLYDSGEPQANVVYTLPSSYDYTNINEGRIYQAGITPGPSPIDPGGQLVGMSVSSGKSSLSTNEEQTVNTRTSGTKSLTKASSSDLGVIDAYSISVDKYSDGGQIRIQGTINGDNYSFIQYESENGWYCNNDDNTYEHISIRISSTNGIYDEQSLKTILALKPLTLEEKINSMSSSDEPLENKLYAHSDQVCILYSVPNWEKMGEALSDWDSIYTYTVQQSPLKQDVIYVGEESYSSQSGVFMDYIDANGDNCEYAIYNEDWTDNIQGDGYAVAKDTWYKITYDSESPYTRYYTEEVPSFPVRDGNITNLELFECIFDYTPEINQTLKEKFDSYKDWTYDKKDATYRLLTPDWETIDTTNTGTIYENRASIHSPSDDELNYCKYAALGEAYEIETYETDEIYELVFEKVIGFDQSDDAITEAYYNFNKDCVVGYGSTQQLTKGVWYKGTYDEDLDYTVFEEVNNVEMLFRDYYIKDGYEELFESLIQYIPEEITTLDEKLKYLITDYTEDSGTLTSITVKDKTTGEPTVLTVGGGKQLYQHNFVFSDTGLNGIFTFSNDNPNLMTKNEIAQYLTAKGCTSSDKGMQCNAVYAYNNSRRVYHTIYCENGTITIFGKNISTDSDAYYSTLYGSDKNVIPL